MAELPYDIILHKILTRLPLKDATRCRILNKHFYTALSTPKFMRDHLALLSSSSNPIIFHNTSTKFTTISSPVRKSITLSDEGMILLDSCNGILFLHDTRSKNYYIFNPFTGGVMFLNYYQDPERLLRGTLVVNMNPSSTSSSSSNTFDFKIVELVTEETVAHGARPRMRFRVFVPAGRTKLVMREVDWDYEGSFDPLIIDWNNWRPVYGHGCVHWLGVGATAIAAFDVESGRARVIDGPVREAIKYIYFQTWFGFAHGSLQFIRIDYSNREQISVHTHNYVTQEWRVAHKIQMPYGVWVLQPMFFDGLKNVFFHKGEVRSNTAEIHVHDLSVGKWNKRGEVKVLKNSFFDQRYVGFFPTMARVSDFYLSNMLAQPRYTQKGICLLALQRLLLDSF